MAPVYGAAAWPAQERTRRRDAVDPAARYVFARALPGSSATAGALLAFLHFRFVVEEGVPVLYVYELQAAAAARGRGLGKYLMLFAEQLARKAPGLAGVVLTLQRANPRAQHFYTQRCGFALASISPAVCDPGAALEEYDYEIYCKLHCPVGAAALERVGQQTRLRNALLA